MKNLVNSAEGTVIDTSSSLIWQKETCVVTMNWKEAISYCNNLTFSGCKDWRLPTRQELESIVDYNYCAPIIDNKYFPDTFLSLYWTSTTHIHYTDHAWAVDFTYGGDSMIPKVVNLYVRAVRGGV